MPADDVVFADLVDADPAPRELTPVARRYLTAQSSYVWVVLAVLFLLLPSVMTAAFVFTGATAANAALTAAVVGVLVLWTSKKRRAYRRVLVEGTQRPARLADVSHLVVRRGMATTARRVTLVVEVDGQRARCVSWAGDLDEAERGAWIRVLVHPDVPGVVVPVVSVT